MADFGTAGISGGDVLVDDLGKQVGGVSHSGVLKARRLGEQGHAGGDQLGQVGFADGGVVPVDVGLGSAERLGRVRRSGAEALAGGPAPPDA